MREYIPRKFSFQLITSSGDNSGHVLEVLILLHSCSVDVTLFAAQTFRDLGKQHYVAAAL